ncbi:MAG TPA: hypothetical protein VGS08_04310 [Candidatus Saccharimonadales bacterium]|nr:hypothetical protein [Candidatus Saccharimonadales bacterium]
MTDTSSQYVGDYKPEGPLPSWPVGNSNGTIEESDYGKRLDYRLVDAGRSLDKTVAKISSQAQGQQFRALKDSIAQIKRNTNPYTKVDDVITLEKKVRQFAKSVDA